MKLALAWLVTAAITGCSNVPEIADEDDDGAAVSETPTVTPDIVDDDLAADPTPAAPPHLEAFFNVPLADGTGDKTAENKIDELIGMTVAGSHLRMSMFNFTHHKPADALIDAAARGVHVDLVIDYEANLVDKTPALAFDGDELDDASEADDAPDLAEPAAAQVLNPAVQSLVDAKSANLTITFCKRGKGSCQGTGIDHNKIYMFSHLSDGSKYVVVQSSANLTTYHLHNALVVSRNDQALYTGYVHYWNDLAAHHEDLNYYHSIDGNHTIAYFFPRNDGGDTIVNVLDKVKCTDKHHGTIRVAMAFFSRVDVATKLAELANNKYCNVQVAIRKKPDTSPAVSSALEASKRLTIHRYPSANGTNIHSKYLIIDAMYDTKGKGYVRRKLVFTGSHNYTGGALKTNDEALLRVDDPDVFDAFSANWKTIQKQID